MVRKTTRAAALKASEKVKKDTPRKSRRRKSSSSSSDDEVLSRKVQPSVEPIKQDVSEESSDVEAKKPLKKRTRSITATETKRKTRQRNTSESSQQSVNEDSYQNSEEVTKISVNATNLPDIEEVNEDQKGKLDIAVSEDTQSESNVQVAQEPLPVEPAAEENNKNGVDEDSAIDVNVSQSLVADMTCETIKSEETPIEEENIQNENVDNSSSTVAAEESTQEVECVPVPLQENEVKPKKKLTIKRPSIVVSQESPEEVKEEVQVPAEKDEWNSGYEKGDDEKHQKKRITLKRVAIVEDEKSELIEDKNYVPVKTDSSSSLDRIVINERRRSSVGERKPEVLIKEESIKPEVKPKPAKTVKLNRPSVDVNEELDAEKLQKSSWKHPNSVVYISVLPNIDFPSLKETCPDVGLLDENQVDLEIRQRSPAKLRTLKELEDEEMESIEAELNAEPEESESKENIIALNRKISIVEDTASKLRPPPSPAKNPQSEILFIRNLVRPFTAKQLQELLERTGKIIPNGLWMDKIKSKCYVCYESAGEAEATRNALHGVHWPIGNGKKLIIDYATAEDMELARNPPVVVPKKEATPEKENKRPDVETSLEQRERDWELDERRDTSRSKHERERKHSRRSYTPDLIDHPAKKRKREEPPPPKAMDDLFSKTKATPSIYWQPLSPEEIAKKQQQRQARLEQNKRRLEEIRGSGRVGVTAHRERSYRRH